MIAVSNSTGTKTSVQLVLVRQTNHNYCQKWYTTLKNWPTAGALFPELAASKSQDSYPGVNEGLGTVNRCLSLTQ